MSNSQLSTRFINRTVSRFCTPFVYLLAWVIPLPFCSSLNFFVVRPCCVPRWLSKLHLLRYGSLSQFCRRLFCRKPSSLVSIIAKLAVKGNARRAGQLELSGNEGHSSRVRELDAREVPCSVDWQQGVFFGLQPSLYGSQSPVSYSQITITLA